MDVIKVSGTSRTSAVAGAIAGVVRERQRAEVQAIGASAVNQAVKAVALARGYLTNDGYNIICIPDSLKLILRAKSAQPFASQLSRTKFIYGIGPNEILGRSN